MSRGRKCRVCGCTEDNACQTQLGPCLWIEDDLCSACAIARSSPDGAGKYDVLCEIAREATHAEGVALMVINGCHGNGFSVQMPPEMAKVLPRMLRNMADQVEAQMPGEGK